MNIWDNAKNNAQLDCPRCHGTGTYMYDDRHGTICDLCCRHNMGWFLCGPGHGKNAGKWCCEAGCGKLVEKRPDDR